MDKKQKIELFANLVYSYYPDAKTELYYENNFQLLVAIIMSAQTTDKQVNKVNLEFFKVLKSPKDGVNLWVKNITKYISSIWFFNAKAKNIFLTCEILSKDVLENFDTLEKLQTLPWVWIKTAKVFLAVTKNLPYLAVDTHVHRVLNRVWIVKAKTPLETDKKVEKTLKRDDLAKLHHSLILFWRYICKAQNPDCKDCKLKEICNFYNKKNQNL